MGRIPDSSQNQRLQKKRVDYLQPRPQHRKFSATCGWHHHCVTFVRNGHGVSLLSTPPTPGIGLWMPLLPLLPRYILQHPSLPAHSDLMFWVRLACWPTPVLCPLSSCLGTGLSLALIWREWSPLPFIVASPTPLLHSEDNGAHSHSQAWQYPEHFSGFFFSFLKSYLYILIGG